MKKGLIPVLVAVILAGALVWVARIVSDTALSIKNKGYVSVKGFAKQEITADLGILRATIVTENPLLQAAYGALALDKRRVESFLRSKHQMVEGSYEFMPAGIREVYVINERGYDTDEFVKFILRQDMKVESSDVEKIERLATSLIDILNEGVKIQIGNPEFVYTKLDELKVEMIGHATNNARERALKIAKEGKFKLGPVASVRVGIFQITPVHSTDVSDYGMNDTSSIKKEIKSVVEIKYFVK